MAIQIAKYSVVVGRPLAGFLAALAAAFVLTACGDGASRPGTGQAERDGPPEQVPTVAEPTPDPEAPPPGPAAGLDEPETCPPGAPADRPAGWKVLTGGAGDFSLPYPDPWDDLSGLVRFRVGTLLDEATLAEAGLDPEARLTAAFVRDPDGFPNLTVFRFEGVALDLEVLLRRQVERLEAVDEVREVHTTLPPVCLGETRAIGLELFFEREGERFYQQSLFAVREGAAYHVQWLDRDDRAVPRILRRILNGWTWAGAASESMPGPGPESQAERCEAAPPTRLSSDWRRFHSPESGFAFTLRHPPAWEDHTGRLTFQPGELLDPVTRAELTSEPEPRRRMAAALVEPDSGATFLVMAVDGVRSSTAEIYPRMLGWVTDDPEVWEVLASEAPGCLDGEPALGFELRGRNIELDLGTGELEGTEEEVFLQGWFLVRDASFYYLQSVGADRTGADVAAELLRTWEWSDALAHEARASEVFLSAGMVLERPPSGGSVDPGAFRSSFPGDVRGLSLVYELAPGTETRVTFLWRHDGRLLFTDTFRWTARTSWAWAGIAPPPGGFEPGSYEVEIGLDSGERHTVPFTIEGR